MGMAGTKWTLFNVSVDLFSERGFHDVSVRDIAKEAGIKVASIYNHFSSKDQILITIYEYYDYYYSFFSPTMETVMEKVETGSRMDVLSTVLFQFDPSIQDIMDKIFLIASTQLYSDKRADAIIYKNIFQTTEERMRLVLNRMVELKKIEPIDTDAFILILTSMCHSTALRTRTSFPTNWEVWFRGVEMLFSVLKEPEQKG